MVTVTQNNFEIKSELRSTKNDLHSSSWPQVQREESLRLFLDFSLSSNSLHCLSDCFLVSQELHGPQRLQVLVKLIHNGNASGQVQLHDGLL